MRPLVVVNPQAGGGRAGRAFGELKPIIERALGPIDVAFTERTTHAIDLARDAANGGRALIIALGGDGTLHEVSNGVLDSGSPTTAIGFIGQGTGGDFRRSLGIEHRLDHYLAAIKGGRERRIDAAKATFHHDTRATSRWFVNILSAGLGGLVDRYVARANRGLGSTFAYASAALRALSESQPAGIDCTIHRGESREERRVDAYVVAVCNGHSFGSGMRIAPMAEPDDGRLEVIVMTASSKLGLAAQGAKLYKGAHLGEPGVTHFSCDALDLKLAPGADRDASREVLLDIDGEPLGALPARIAIARGALRVRA